jgi:hypothetical protein
LEGPLMVVSLATFHLPHVLAKGLLLGGGNAS